MSEKWIVDVKGDCRRAGEITVLREDNHHGKASYGWTRENKILIAGQGGPCEYTYHPEVWAGRLLVAHDIANKLNAGTICHTNPK